MDLGAVDDAKINEFAAISQRAYVLGNPTLGSPIDTSIVSVDEVLDETVEDAEGNLLPRFERGTGGSTHIRLYGGTFQVDLAGKKVSLRMRIYIILPPVYCFVLSSSVGLRIAITANF